jgi:hypothetical protein
MGIYLSSNNATSILASALPGSALSTSLIISAADGAKFPTINQGGVGTDWTFLTLQDASANVEVVRVDRHDAGSSAFTVSRGQQGTAIRAWLSGDSVALRLTADTINSMTQGLADVGNQAVVLAIALS